MSVNKNSIEDKIKQLEELLTWFESDEVTVEAAVEKYDLASRIALDLESELETAKNKVEVIKKKYA